MKLKYRTDYLITHVRGVECSGVRVKGGGLGLVRCSGTVAGVFTRNKFRAAPVILTQKHISDGHIEGIIVNSGNANAYTGEKGIENAKKMAEMYAEKLGCEEKDIAVSSTGVIGVQLDMKWIESLFNEVYPKIGDGDENAWNFAKAITTTDAFTKQWGVKVGDAVIAGVAKGAGMIAPNMATMLCYVFTDAEVNAEDLNEILRYAVNRTFNSITVDGDTSTNDTVLLVSTGRKKLETEKLKKAVLRVCSVLAEMIVADGEGATKLIRVFVSGARNDEEAYRAARAVASSTLVKTAVFGGDPNWGRIVAALGYSGAEAGEITLEIYGKEWRAEDSFALSCVDEGADKMMAGMGRERNGTTRRVRILDRGRETGNREKAREAMKGEVVEIHIDLGVGEGKASFAGCDLSYDYVRLNSEYTT